MNVWRIVGESHVRTELLETGLALVAVAIGVNQAADRSKVSRLEPGYFGSDLGDTADYLMSGNTRIDSWHCAPLITDLVEVRVTDTAEKNFDLNVVFARITPRDRRGGKRRLSTRQLRKP